MAEHWINVTIRLRKKILVVTEENERPKYPDVMKTLNEKYGFKDVGLTLDDVFIDNVARVV